MRVPFIFALFGWFLVPAPASAELQQLYGPYFAADANHTSRLLIHNKRGDLPVSARVYALVRGSRVVLADLTLARKESRVLQVKLPLVAAGGSEGDGSLLVEYDFFERQPLDGSVLVQHRNGSQYVVPLFRRDQVRGTTQEAVVVLPHASARAFISVQNTVGEERLVRVEVETERGSAALAPVVVEPYDARKLALDDVLARAGARDAASIRVINSGSAGDVVVAGAIVDPRDRYAGRVRFNDLAHGEHSRTLRAQFLLLGRQDPSWGFRADSLFTAKCAVRNASESLKVIRPRVKWLESGAMRVAELPALRLQPREVRIVDLSAAQTRGEIPASFHFGSMEIPYEGEGGHVFTQLTSTDTVSGLVLDTSMTSHESHAVAGMEWTTEGDQQTLLSIANAAPRPDTLAVQLFAGGQTIDLPPLHLAGGEITLLDLRAVAVTQGIDVSRGTFAVRGAHGSRSAFRLERLMVSSRGLSAEAGQSASDGPVMYVDVDGDERVLWIRTTTSDPDDPEQFPPPEDSVTLDLSTIARWSSGTATTDETNTTEYVTSSPDLSIRQPPSPQVTVFISIYRPPSIAELIARFYDPCANNYMLTFQIRVASPLSAYQITGNFHPICEYRPTCWGTCTTSSYTTIAATQTCTPPGQPFVQCAGLAINGNCLLRNFVCLPSSSPGICN